MQWLISNKEWLFSGVGLSAVMGCLFLLKKYFFKKTHPPGLSKKTTLIQGGSFRGPFQIGDHNQQNNYYGPGKDQ